MTGNIKNEYITTEQEMLAGMFLDPESTESAPKNILECNNRLSS
jgi:hypothetical protein